MCRSEDPRLGSQILKRKKFNINLCLWNIHGHTSKLIGDKLSDLEFLHICRDSEILGLAELHTDTTLSIPGYRLIKQKNRRKIHKGPKISGGPALFAKNGISLYRNMIKYIPNALEDSLRVKVKEEETSEDKDIYIGTVCLYRNCMSI